MEGAPGSCVRGPFTTFLYLRTLCVIFWKYDNYIIISPNYSPNINNSRIV